MSKDDVKAIVLIFFMLLLISVIVVFGIYMYKNNIETNEGEMLYEGNSTVLPYEENTTPLVVQQGNSVLNQIASAGNQIQTEQPNISVADKDEYYYEQLNPYEKIIYDELKNNREHMKSGTYKIDFGKAFNKLLEQENGTKLLQEYYQSAMESYLYDNPEVFYLDPTKMYINIQTTKKVFSTTYEVYIDSGENVNYLAEGYTSKEQIINYENQINQEAKKILAQTEGKSDYQKILTVHDYLVDNVAYEETISKDNIYNAYGALVNKESVCEGYAKAFKHLMDQAGIDSIVVIGEATDTNGKTQSHAWNYVNLNNIWYAIDVTWDDPIVIGGGKLGKSYKYKYFLKGSTTIGQDHVPSYAFVNNGKEYTHPTLSLTDY